MKEEDMNLVEQISHELKSDQDHDHDFEMLNKIVEELRGADQETIKFYLDFYYRAYGYGGLRSLYQSLFGIINQPELVSTGLFELTGTEVAADDLRRQLLVFQRILSEAGEGCYHRQNPEYLEVFFRNRAKEIVEMAQEEVTLPL